MNLSLSELARRYHTSETTPLEVVEHSLAAASQTSGVFTAVLAHQARAEARASTLRWKQGQPLSELDGVPVAWKDLIDIQGVPTTSGRAGVTAPAVADAGLVRQARQAGLIGIGKTNLSELAYSGLGVNPHHGTPVHPAFPQHVPGGSSSGAAIALACDVVPLSIGTDTGGSIRIPASFNGLVGFRPTIGRYAMDGIQPLAPSFDTVGPLARSVADIIAFDRVFSHDQEPEEQAPALVYDPDFLVRQNLEPQVWESFLNTIEILRACGMQIEARPITAWRAAVQLILQEGWPGGIEAYQTHRELLSSSAAEALDPRVRTRLLLAQNKTDADLAQIHGRRAALQLQLAAELPGVMLTPTVAITSPSLDDVKSDEAFTRLNLEALRLTMPGSLLDQPGLSLPAGQIPTGRPVGLLLSAAQGNDHLVLQAALTVERALAADQTRTSTDP